MEKSANAHIEIPKVGKVITVQIVTMLVAVISLMIDGVMTSIYLGDESHSHISESASQSADHFARLIIGLLQRIKP